MRRKPFIPILYEYNETEFTTEGIGRLTDVLSGTHRVTEERNGIYELEFQYPVGGIHYEDLTERRIILDTHDATLDLQPFEIYKVTKPMDGIVTVHAQHISYRLTGVITGPFTASGVSDAMQKLKTFAKNMCPFTFTSSKAVTGSWVVQNAASIRSLLAGQEGSLLDRYGKGEYTFDKFNVHLDVNRGTDTGIVIRYGVNLTDLTEEVDSSSLAFGVVPYWKGNDDQLVQSNPQTCDYYDEDDPIKSQLIAVDFTSKWNDSDSTPTAEWLNEQAESYMEENEPWAPKTSLTISFEDVNRTAEFDDLTPLATAKLCDYITVVYKALGVKATAEIIKTVWDPEENRYVEMEVGDPARNLNTVLTSQFATKDNLADQMEVRLSLLQEAVLNATELITGNLGGYVILHDSSGDGKPDEILIMDTPSIATATKVWRWNASGLGYSSTGYNGTYGTAITMNGAIVADYITAGTMYGERIKAGILSDVHGLNYWNLETGDLHLNAYSDTDDMNAAISASASGITSTVSATYETKSDATAKLASANSYTDNALGDYSTTVQVQSMISQEASSITASVSSTYETKSDATAKLTTAEGYTDTQIATAKAEIKITTDGISSTVSQKVGKNEVISSINQSAESVTINANKINLSGYVTVSDLSTSGSTTINGDNITTGKIESTDGLTYFDLANARFRSESSSGAISAIANGAMLCQASDGNTQVLLSDGHIYTAYNSIARTEAYGGSSSAYNDIFYSDGSTPAAGMYYASGTSARIFVNDTNGTPAFLAKADGNVTATGTITCDTIVANNLQDSSGNVIISGGSATASYATTAGSATVAESVLYGSSSGVYTKLDHDGLKMYNTRFQDNSVSLSYDTGLSIYHKSGSGAGAKGSAYFSPSGMNAFYTVSSDNTINQWKVEQNSQNLGGTTADYHYYPEMEFFCGYSGAKVTIGAEATGDSRIVLNSSGNRFLAQIHGDNDVGGKIQLWDSAGKKNIEVDSTSYGGRIHAYNSNGIESFTIGTSGDGTGLLQLRDSSGTIRYQVSVNSSGEVWRGVKVGNNAMTYTQITS